MRKTLGVCVLGLLVISGRITSADPITVTQFPGSAGATLTSVDTSIPYVAALNLVFTRPGDALLQFAGLHLRTNILVNVGATNHTAVPWSVVEFEMLDPLGDHDDGRDVTPSPSYVPAGWSTSNGEDGISFHHAVARHSDRLPAVAANDQTDAHDILDFSGGTVRPGQTAHFFFGLRESLTTPALLLRVAPDPGASPSPEPASMLLLGSGAIGLGWRRLRRRAQ